MVGLNHGLGKAQDLLRQSELEKASRVRTARSFHIRPQLI
jgi:hypothetical protein